MASDPELLPGLNNSEKRMILNSQQLLVRDIEIH